MLNVILHDIVHIFVLYDISFTDFLLEFWDDISDQNAVFNKIRCIRGII